MQAAFVLQRLTPDVVRVLGKEEQIYLVFKMPGITQLLVAALLITWTASASPQFQKLGYEGPLRADGTVDSLQDELQLGSAPQRKDLLGRLGVSAELPAETRDAIELVTQVEKIEGTGAALLTLPCRSRSLYAFLYLLRKNAGGRWQAVDSVTLDCWWHPATHRLVFVPKHSGDLILAEHVGAGHGSGLAVDNMALYEVRGDKLVRVLITEQEKSKVTWGGPALRTESTSTLLPLPDGSLEETQSTIVYREDSELANGRAEPPGLTSVRRRCWSWEADSQTYHSSAFTSVHR